MAYLSDDELLDTEGGLIGWDDKIGGSLAEEHWNRRLRKNSAEAGSELEQASIPSIMMPNWKPRRRSCSGQRKAETRDSGGSWGRLEEAARAAKRISGSWWRSGTS